MAYFDSPKNKALWDKEIARLETERERRRQNGFKPVDNTLEDEGEKSFGGKQSAKVRLITLEELERIVREKKGLAPRGRGREMAGAVKEKGSRANERDAYVLRAGDI